MVSGVKKILRVANYGESLQIKLWQNGSHVCILVSANVDFGARLPDSVPL